MGTGLLQNEPVPQQIPLSHVDLDDVACSNTLTGTIIANLKVLMAVVSTLHGDMYYFGAGNPRVMRVKFEWGYPSLHAKGEFKV